MKLLSVLVVLSSDRQCKNKTTNTDGDCGVHMKATTVAAVAPIQMNTLDRQYLSSAEAGRIARMHLLTWTGDVLPKKPLHGFAGDVQALDAWSERDDIGNARFYLLTHDDPEIIAVNHVL